MASPPPDDSNARVHPLKGMPGPRWDRDKGIYPTSLRRYLECPHRCRLEYIDKVRYTQTWVRAIEVGNALHKVMERIGNALHNHHIPPAIASLRPYVDELLPEDEYENQEDRTEDIDKVLDWAELGEGYIREGVNTILRVERHYPRRWDDRGELGTVMLGAKADVVMRREDETGQYVEIIDYKSGYSRKWSQFTPMLSRIALDHRLRRALPEQKEPRVVFTYLWFAHDEIESITLTRDHMHNEWRELKRILTRMVHEERWPMRPSPKVCKHCPYFDIECFPYPQAAAFTALDASAERG